LQHRTRVPAIQPTSDDRQLIDTVLAGDSEAFRVLVDRESRQILAVCRRILGDHEEAEDVAPDTFVRAYRSLATFRGDGPFAAWIARIAARQAVARLVARPDVTQLDDDAAAASTATLRSGDDPEAARSPASSAPQSATPLPPSRLRSATSSHCGSSAICRWRRSARPPAVRSAR